MPTLTVGANVHVRGAARSVSSTTFISPALPFTFSNQSSSSLQSFSHQHSPRSFTPIINNNSTPTSTSTKSISAPISISSAKTTKPVLTPRSSADSSSSFSSSCSSSVDSSVYTEEDNVILAVFPSSSPIHLLPSSPVDLSSIADKWQGAVLENEKAGTRTLYVAGGNYEDVNLKESVCGILELAEDVLGCTGVVMILEKYSADLGDLLHSLMYVGGTITNQPFPALSDYVLVGLDL